MTFDAKGESLTYEKAFDILERLRGRLFGTKSCPYPCKFLHTGDMKDQEGNEVTLSVLEGQVRAVANGEARGGFVRVYGAVIRLPDTFFDEDLKYEPVDAYEFLGAVVALFHERQHVDQYMVAAKGGSEYSNLMYLVHMSNSGNPEYTAYNYYADPSEVEAQYVGLLSLHSFLQGMVGDSEADRYVCFYQETCNKKTLAMKESCRKMVADGEATQEQYDNIAHLLRDFIELPESGSYAGVQDIFERYESAFESSISHHRQYPERYLESNVDSLAKYFNDHKGVYKRFTKEKDGYEGLKMLLNIQLESDGGAYEPGLYKTNRRKFDRLKASKARMITSLHETRDLDVSDEVTVAKPLLGRLVPSLYGFDSGSDVAVRVIAERKTNGKYQGALSDEELKKMVSSVDFGPGGPGNT